MFRSFRFIFLILQIFIFARTTADTFQQESPKITVIGAGLAGLTTAYRLQAMGYPVEVYEARNRPGGRICTAYFGSTYEELGGKNIDDASDPTEILSLIHELGLQLQTSTRNDTQGKMTVLNGEMTPFLSAFKDGPEPNDHALNILRNKTNELKSLGDLMDFFFTKNPIVRQRMEWIMSEYEGTRTYGLTPYYLDISFWKFYKKCYEISHGLREDENLVHTYVEGGNSHLIKALVKHLEGHIHYNAVLNKINRSENGSELKLYFNKDDPISTNYLVLALPCTTLRDVEIESNIIPKDQMFAIQTLQYGCSAKMLLPVKISEETITKSLVTENIFTWLNHDNSVMTWWYIGPKGIFDFRSPEILCDKINDDINAIRMVYPGIEFPYGLTPCPKKECLETVYAQPVGISWINEEFSKGGYSNHGIDNFNLFQKNCEDYQELVLHVFRSIDGRIFFAGEHTDFDDFGTMGGAVRSGEKAARMLERALKNSLINSNAEENDDRSKNAA